MKKKLLSCCAFPVEETDDSRSNSRMDPTTRGALGYSKPIGWRGKARDHVAVRMHEWQGGGDEGVKTFGVFHGIYEVAVRNIRGISEWLAAYASRVCL